MAYVIARAKIVSDNTGVAIEIPVLVTQGGPLVPLIDYCLQMRRSLSWMNKLLRATSLFLEYLEANLDQPEEWRLFRNFANALRLGTINKETGLDPSGLCWSPFQGPDVDYYVILLSDFFDWLAKERANNGDVDVREEGLNADRFNPKYEGSAYDKRINERAYQYRRSKAFLGHAWSDNPGEAGKTRHTRGTRRPKISKDQEPEFPEDRFEELLFKGFKKGKNYDWRGMAITTLLHGAGFRECEPFHLYISDVQPHWDDASIAFVAIHHPSYGVAPSDWQGKNGRRGTREQYLAHHYSLSPRDHMGGSRRAGWKDPALDVKYFMQAWWFPDAEYGRLFLQIWKRYLEQVQRTIRNHPFAFVNLERGTLGDMYTLKQYLRAHEAAVNRIGLISSKPCGTTPHGHRHAYGRRLMRAGVDPILIQRVMHHCSPDSQLVYTQPQREEAIHALNASAQKIREKHGNILMPAAPHSSPNNT